MNGQDNLQILAEVQGAHGTGTTYYMNDGSLYLSYQVTNGARYFRCNKYKSGCPARVIFYSNGTSSSTGLHDHLDAIPELVYRSNRIDMMNQVYNSTSANFQDIFTDQRNAGLTANPLFSRHRLLPSMIRAQRRQLPQCDSLVQLSAVLSNPAYSSLTCIDPSHSILYRGCAQCANGSTVILFMSSKGYEFLQKTPSAVFLHVPVVLADLQQVEICIVGGIWVDNVIPSAWILAESYTPEAVLAGFTLLKSFLTQYAFSKAICTPDFAAFIFARVFSVEVYPSLYDFINDVASQVERTVNFNNPVMQVAQLCCSLPLLPMDCLQLGIDFVKRHAILLGESTYGEASRVFHFIEEEWLKIPVKRFSVSGNIDRTNYGCESLKSCISAKFAQSTHDFYSVIRYIVSEVHKLDKQTDRLLLGHTISRRIPVPLLQQQDVVVLLQEVVRPSFSAELSVKNFLVAVSEKIRHLLVF